MKRILIMFSLMTLLAVSAFAKTSGNKDAGANATVSSSQNLEFTQDQRQKIKSVQDQYMKDVQKIEDMNVSQQEKEEAHKQAVIKSRDKLTQILTPKQLEILMNSNL
jgi:Spy/CpxP family protein refolding chaperone